MRSKLILVVAIAVLFCALWQINALADSKIYWFGAYTFDDQIWRANLDGSGEEGLVPIGETWSIALDTIGGKVYWGEINPAKIRCANLDGSGATDLITTGINYPGGIAIDAVAGKMYWTDFDTGKIQCANLDGSKMTDLITTGLIGPAGIALDVGAGKMYWTDLNKIQRANLDGSEVEDVITGFKFVFDIALDIGNWKMYWTDVGSKKIQSANLDGSGVTDLVTITTPSHEPWGIALDITGGKMYWTSFSTGEIRRANLDGSEMEKVISGFLIITGIALDVPRPTLKVAVDIKPLSCPNPLNVKSTGVLPVAVLGSEDFDVSSIDAASIRLAGVAPIRSSYEDVATPVSDSNECECSTEGPDGFFDLTLKFETQEIVEAIGEVNHGDELMLELTGVLSDETLIEGSDCINIRGRHKPLYKADFNGDGIIDMADFADFSENWLQSSIIGC